LYSEYTNNYARLLAQQGKVVISESGIDWVKYGHFMIPAYLPHRIPEISNENAKEVLKRANCPFVRWESKVGEVHETEWWFIVKRGPWSWDNCTSKTRNRIRRAQKYSLRAERVEPEIVLKNGYEICKKVVVERYKRNDFLPDYNDFQKRIKAAKVFNDNFHLFGVFEEKKLIGFAENYIQDKAVFWESIWYDPEYLPKHSSYILLNEMLDYYLNQMELLYINDGSRNIYHKTNVHEFMIKVFGFQKEFSNLNLIYSPLFNRLIQLAFGFKNIFEFMDEKWDVSLFSKISAVLLQEQIRRSCLNK